MAGWKCRMLVLLRQLEQENERLKKLLADSMLDNAMLKVISAKKF